MNDLIWLSDGQMRRIERHFPRSHSVPRINDQFLVGQYDAGVAMTG
jgi:putative transposase